MDSEKLENLADTHGTPLYVIDTEKLCKRYLRLTENLPFLNINFASKSNFDSQVIRELNKEDAGFAAGSSQEAAICHNLGVSLGDIQVSAISPKDESINQMVKMSNKNKEFTVSINDFNTFKRLKKNNFKGNVLLRLRANLNMQDTSKYENGSSLKFGMKGNEIKQCIDSLSHSKATFKGFHSHLGGSIYAENIDKFYEHVKYTLSQVQKHVKLSDVDIINFGGGLNAPTKPEEKEINLEKFQDNLRDILPRSETEYIIEPGKYISAPTTVLLTKVNTIRESNPTFVGVDAGMSDFLRPTMFDIDLHITNLHGKNHLSKHTVSGPTCSGADVFCYKKEFKEVQQNDILVIHNVGAYSVVMTTNFHGYTSPKIVSIDGKESKNITELIQNYNTLQ